jgi:hypothetical protein
MSVLILHLRGSLNATPYDRWLSDYDGKIILLCSREHLDLLGENLPQGGGYHHVEAVSGYEASGRVEARALELAREHDVQHVIACQEQDLERAAVLREILGLPGQTLDSVLPFRNKVMMKDSMKTAGIPVAEYRDVECATDVISFAERHGFPVVIKPRDGAGSFGVRILRTPADLDAFLTNEFDLYGAFQSNLMVESFVSESMCHVDGLVVDGHVVYAWSSRYLYALAVFEGDLGGRLDVTLDADDPLNRRLLAFTDRIIDALPSPPTFAFHAEIFYTPDDRLVLGEIACRASGAAGRDIQRTLFGLDPVECSVRAQLGLPLPFTPGAPRLQPASLTGQLALLKRPGRVLTAPTQPPFPWIVAEHVFIKEGQIMRAAAYPGDFMVLYVISAPTREESVRRMRELETWFLDELTLGKVSDGELYAASGLAGTSEAGALPTMATRKAEHA